MFKINGLNFQFKKLKRRPNQLESIQEKANNNNKSENQWKRNIPILEKKTTKLNAESLKRINIADKLLARPNRKKMLPKTDVKWKMLTMASRLISYLCQ